MMEPEPVQISLHMITRRHLPPNAQSSNHEQVLDALHKITHLRLDREHIAEIDGLELLGMTVANIYLQQNLITQIENLDHLTNISFITLAGNRIKELKNLKRLTKLTFLDVSENQIENVDTGELPSSLIMLNLKDNPCTHLPSYRSNIIKALPKLKLLDDVDVTRHERKEVGCTEDDTSSNEDEEEDEDEDDDEGTGDLDNAEDGVKSYTADISSMIDHTASLPSITTNMLHRSQNRLEDYQRDYVLRSVERDAFRLRIAALSGTVTSRSDFT